jgi:hypothetical protein
MAVELYAWADVDPDAHTATSHRLNILQQEFPNLLPATAISGWAEHLPGDVRSIS